MDIERTPTGAGVYAWYFRPQIPRADIEACTSAIEAADDVAQRRAAVRNLLERTILQYVTETPYVASIRGELKPSYTGRLHHVQEIGNTILDQFADNMDAFEDVRKLMNMTPTGFMSPLYIGMSRALRGRLLQHKSAILKDVAIGPRVQSNHAENAATDQAFAMEVRRRGIPPSRLFAVVQPLEAGSEALVEYLLNRISFPVYGRR